MTLKFQRKTIQLNKIYRVDGVVYKETANQANAHFYIKGGTVDIHATSEEEIPTSLAEMELSEADEDIGGHQDIKIYPTYFCVVQNTGTTETLIVCGLNVTEVGSI